jgi:hypothetical protein
MYDKFRKQINVKIILEMKTLFHQLHNRLKVVGNEMNRGWRLNLNNLYIYRNVVIEVCFQFD